MLAARKSLIARILALLVVCGCLVTGNAFARDNRAEAPAFNVIAFYHGTFDAAHIDFVKEANQKFPQLAAQHNFTYTPTTNWDLLNNLSPSQYQVVLFLDDSPDTAAQRAGFQRYMDSGGGFLGFHVAAFNTSSGNWPWYFSTLLGTGTFRNNTWGPTAVNLKVENRPHASTANLPNTFRSSVSEWYSWNNDLRNNPNISILASIDNSSFPVGTDPNQTWYNGYYPIIWTNKNFKMIYANFGHNAMNYQTNTRLSSTFESPAQNQFLVDALKWLGGAGGSVPPVEQPNPAAWYSVANKANSKCVDARAAGTANGTVIQQYACNASTAQQFQFATTSDGFTRVNNRNDATKVVDVSGVSTSDNAGLQLWAYGGGNNQQWKAVPEGDGYFHFVARHSNKCLTVPNGSTADSVQLVQLTCNGGASQSFRLTQA
ncbi:ThuA domain-containing protein [Kribbella deserti]|uniref:ThuA domain-containing protein n=1 Tax=Kribbella deserti TaxID=1926257 RepID=A0ABV6QTS4_9ACTN